MKKSAKKPAKKSAKKSIGLLILGLALLAYGCGGSGAPTDYNNVVQDNFMSGCTEGLEENPQQEQNFERICACSYREIQEQIDFEDFEELNKALQEDIRKLSEQDSEDRNLRIARQIIIDCINTCRDNAPTSKCQPFIPPDPRDA